MRGDEAIQAVTYFIDDAILLGIDRVRIKKLQQILYKIHLPNYGK